MVEVVSQCVIRPGPECCERGAAELPLSRDCPHVRLGPGLPFSFSRGSLSPLPLVPLSCGGSAPGRA